ncbi:MAG: hypothetical protein FWE02_02955 [Defluviitaleaceae bacterium]|nr:hypothetical protein [Defluviitaleaceae bacterium]
MLELIRSCKKCKICENQIPLVYGVKSAEVFWVGLSAKKLMYEGEKPISPKTNSGALISKVEENIKNISTYRTNLVKCVPLDNNGKLRYPNKKEMDTCMANFEIEIKVIKPKTIFLLGTQVRDTISRSFSLKFPAIEEFNYQSIEYRTMNFIAIHHPSYVYIYKRKQINNYMEGILKCL